MEGRYIRFVEGAPRPRTKTWLLALKLYGGQGAGTIRWFSQWRKYMFFPFAEIGYDHLCLREIADFCEEQTRLHKVRWGKRRCQKTA
jgi:hypothetical protein